jgi:hypothetical protein
MPTNFNGVRQKEGKEKSGVRIPERAPILLVVIPGTPHNKCGGVEIRSP